MGMELGIGIFNGWIFATLFGLMNVVLMRLYPKHYTRRLLTLPTFTSKPEKILSIIYAIMLNLTMLLACFLPIAGGITFVAGLVLYAASLICICAALCAYATTEPDTPVTKSIYKISRHPQQVFTCTMIVGMGLMLSNPIVSISGILQLFLLYPSMIAQERFCVEKYGNSYSEYLHTAPRYFLFSPKNREG